MLKWRDKVEMIKLFVLVMSSLFLSSVSNVVAEQELPYWEEYRREWIRSPEVDKSFEEYVAIFALSYANQFIGCMTRECAAVRESYDNDVWAYVKRWVNSDSFMTKQYYDMRWAFEQELTDLDFRKWERENSDKSEGYDWPEFVEKLIQERTGGQASTWYYSTVERP